MKGLFTFLAGFIIVILVIIISLNLSGNSYLVKGVWATYLHGEKSATIDDARFFETRKIKAGEGLPWAVSQTYNTVELSDDLNTMLTETRSIAFMVIKNDSIQYEQYWDDYTDTSHSNLFSATKSIVTMLAQCAIQDGLIESWDAKVIDFLPKLKGEFAGDLTFRHLSTMTAGLDFNEHYTDPFCITAQMYYSDDVWDLMLEKVPVIVKPGSTFEYQSGATQILGMALIKATGKHLSDYASEKLWQPLGAEHDAYWHIDGNMGTEMAYCCFNTNVRDFGRFGKMLQHQGNFDGTQILDSSFYALASNPYKVPFYSHGFWLDNKLDTKVFYQRGILGQYCIVVPEKNIVIVRMGHERRKEEGQTHPTDYKTYVSEVLKLF